MSILQGIDILYFLNSNLELENIDKVDKVLSISFRMFIFTDLCCFYTKSYMDIFVRRATRKNYYLRLSCF